jgi:hypothetical protein
VGMVSEDERRYAAATRIAKIGITARMLPDIKPFLSDRKQRP